MCTRIFNIVFTLISFSILLISCDEVLPKPKAYLRLSYPTAEYVAYQKDCPISFKVNKHAVTSENDKCEIKIEYPDMKATVYLNYRPITNNINTLLRDAQKLTYEHVIKADDITEQPYENKKQNVYGMFYRIGGNAASNTQFYLTDSSKHFLVGSVYFYSKPNFDSIFPATKYIESDVQQLIESLKWGN